MAKVSSNTRSIQNRKARFDFEILETFESGLQLLGPEVKSIRYGNVNLKGNFIHEWHGDLLVEGIHISPYKFASGELPAPMRKRKLLFHKKELHKIITQIAQKGISAVVLELYFKNHLVKAKVALVRGKQLHDKRETLKRKDQSRELARTLKAFGKS